MLFRTILWQFNSIFIIFRSILIAAIPHMYNLTCLLSLHQVIDIFNPILNLIKFLRNRLDPENIICNLIKATARKYQKMSILRIATLDSIEKFMPLIKDLKLLPNFGDTATINYSPFHNLANISILTINFNLRSFHKTNIKLSNANIRCMIIVIFSYHFPWTM